MNLRPFASLGICFALLASAISVIGSPANAASASPKVITSFGTWGSGGSRVVGDRLFVSNNGAGIPIKINQLYYLDTKMKYRTVELNLKSQPSFDHRFVIYFNDRYFFKAKRGSTEFGAKFLSLDRFDKLKEYNFTGDKSETCAPIGVLGARLYVSCGDFEGGQLFAITKDDSIIPVTFPSKGRARLEYLGTHQMLIRVINETDVGFFSYYAINQDASITHQFDVPPIQGTGSLRISGRLDSGWILTVIDNEMPYLNVKGCEDYGWQTSSSYLITGDGGLTAIGELGPSEIAYSVNLPIRIGDKYFFNKLVTDSKSAPIRFERYAIDSKGQVSIVANTRDSICLPRFTGTAYADDLKKYRDNLDIGFNWPSSLEYTDDWHIRFLAAEKYCPIVSKGKSIGAQTMFNGYAICTVGKDLMAYPVPAWKPPKAPDRLFPLIKQVNTLTSQEIQPQGVGEPSWMYKCPAVRDIKPATHPRVLGFKFDGTGQTFTRLADGSTKPSTQPDGLVGCYVDLPSHDSGMGKNGWGIGAISRGSSGYYWTNAAGVRWGLSLSGSILTTGKESPYYDKGRQFITFK